MKENDKVNSLIDNKASVKKNKRKKLLWIILSVVSFLIIMTVVATTVAVLYVKKNFKYEYNEITSQPEELGFEEVINEKTVNIALFGIDSRQGKSFKGLSDSIMIMSVNTRTQKIKVISVMRDSLVPIIKNGYTSYSKINSAYSRGGPELAIKTLNTIFGLDISEYVTVNFSGMAEIIDAVGGVEIEIVKGEMNQVNACISDLCFLSGIDSQSYLLEKAGLQNLNGIQAVGYARVRKATNVEGTTNDYGRTDRQRYVLQQLFNKAKELKIESFINLVKTLAPCCETSLSFGEAIDLGIDVLLRSPTFEETRVPDTTYTMRAPTTNAGSVVYYDLNFAAKLIHGFIYDDIKPEDYIATNGVEKNNWYASGFNPPTFNHDKKADVSSQNNDLSSNEKKDGKANG